jgi:ligand-binding SRPBCC domain-containing protein
MIVKTNVLRTAQWLPRPRHEIFSLFADASNLEIITPPWLHFKIVTPFPIGMKVGTLIDYSLRLHGVPLRWQSEITLWDPPYRFVDEQRRGPYRLWIHQHIFAEADGGTIAQDRVEYAVPGGALVQRFVSRDLTTIFEYRRWKLQELCDHSSPARTSPRFNTSPQVSPR